MGKAGPYGSLGQYVQLFILEMSFCLLQAMVGRPQSERKIKWEGCGEREKVRGGGAGAFDKLQKSRPVINQAGIRPGIQDPEHLLGLWGKWLGEEGSCSPVGAGQGGGVLGSHWC